MNKDDKRTPGQVPQRPDQAPKRQGEQTPAREGDSNQKDAKGV